MHIEFTLPNGAGGMAAAYRAHRLTTQVNEWAKLHNIQVKKYNAPTYRLCFEFGKASDYTLFALAWTVNSSWDAYTLVD